MEGRELTGKEREWLLAMPSWPDFTNPERGFVNGVAIIERFDKVLGELEFVGETVKALMPYQERAIEAEDLLRYYAEGSTTSGKLAQHHLERVRLAEIARSNWITKGGDESATVYSLIPRHLLGLALLLADDPPGTADWELKARVLLLRLVDESEKLEDIRSEA